jgi:nitrite reductase (NADH) large subunit
MPAYNRVELTSVLGGRDAASLILAPMIWYAERDIDLRIGERVIAVDRRKRVLTTALGKQERYDDLVFATGSFVSTPVVPGTNQRGVFAYRTLEDARRIAERARTLARERARAVVIGSGLLGIEVGQAIAELGCGVTLIEAAPQLLPRQLDPVTAGIAAQLLSEAGFELFVGQRVERILLTSEMRPLRPTRGSPPEAALVPDTRLRVMLASGHAVDCGMVVLASGVKPRDELARASGLACPPPGGIAVDSAMMTSDPHVFAIGECARHADRCTGLVAPGYAMAEVLADRLAGKSSIFTRSEPCTRLVVARRPVVVFGDAQCSGPDVQEHIVRIAGSGAYRRLLMRQDRLIGVTAIGEGEDLAHLQDALVMRTRLRARDLERLAHGIDPWHGQRSTRGRGWPDSATACDCTGVTFGALRRARSEGYRSVEQLCHRTGAGGVCGSCRPRLAAFAASDVSFESPSVANDVVARSSEVPAHGAGMEAASRRDPTLSAPNAPGQADLSVSAGRGGSRARLALISAGVLLSLLLAFYHGPLAVPASVLGPRPLDILWESHLARQLSGFWLALLTSIAALTIAIEKRHTSGRAPSRVLHAVLGFSCLASIGVHSTMRLGSGIDRALALCLLAMIAVGAASALSLSSERWIGGRAGASLRRLGLRLHIWIAWPVPVLLALHVLKSYWF